MKAQWDDIVNDSNACAGGTKNLNDILKLGSKETVIPAVNDTNKVLLLAIDMQADFCNADGSLTVYPGAKRDVLNITKFIYNNIDKISTIMCSMDTHYTDQIFFPSFWTKGDGSPVDPYTMITYDEVAAGHYKSVKGSPKKVMDCLKALETAGKVGVFVWPYHCMVGTPGFNLETEFAAMVHYHSIVRASRPQIVFKGTDMYSERFGIIESEYNPNNIVEWSVINAIANIQTGNVAGATANYSKIILCGEASSHCLITSAEQITKRFSSRPDILSSIIIMEDGTSPVTGFEQQAIDGFAKLKSQFGIQVLKSTDIKL